MLIKSLKEILAMKPKTDNESTGTITMSAIDTAKITLYIKILMWLSGLAVVVLSGMLAYIVRIDNKVGGIEVSNAIALTKIEGNEINDKNHAVADNNRFKNIQDQLNKLIENRNYDYRVNNRRK